MGGRWFLVTMVTLVMVTVVRAERALQCDVECVCNEDKKKKEHDFTVVCNATGLQEATLTEQVLSSLTNRTDVVAPRMVVSVKGGHSLSLSVTAGFFLQWRQFVTCSLSVAGAGRVIFPAVMPPITSKRLHLYVGVTLNGVEVSEVPAGIFSLTAASLSLINSTVGRLPAGLLAGAKSLYHLRILNSTVGVMEGRVGGAALHTTTTTSWSVKKRPVQLINSTVGVLRSGALHLHMPRTQMMVMQGVVLGRVDSGAVEVEGGGVVVVERCMAARVEAAALVLGSDTSLILRNNWLTLRPHAFTHLPCGDEDHHYHRLNDNHISLLDNASGLPVTLTLPQPPHQNDLDAAQWQRVADNLNVVLHPSCVPSNLPPPPTPSPSPSPPTPLLTAKLAAFCLGGLVVGVGVTCVLLLALRCFRRRRRVTPQPLAAVLMSRLHEEPIYAEPSLAPEVPPFPSTLGRRGTCSPSDTCGGGESGDTCRPENDYMITSSH